MNGNIPKKRQIYEFEGTVVKVGEEIVLDTKVMEKNLIKKVLTLDLALPGQQEQLIFIDFLTYKMPLINDLKKGQEVQVTVTFKGSDKNKLIYNNIYGHSIKIL